MVYFFHCGKYIAYKEVFIAAYSSNNTQYAVDVLYVYTGYSTLYTRMNKNFPPGFLFSPKHLHYLHFVTQIASSITTLFSVLKTNEVNKMNEVIQSSNDSPIAITPAEDKSCIVCGDNSKVSSGIYCSGPERHFHCGMCTTQWCDELNKQREKAPDLLRARNGLFKCTSESCTSLPFTPAAVCSVLKDVLIMEGFISNLLHVYMLSMQEKYQADLSEQIAKLQADGSKIREEEARKVELSALAKTLRMTLRQPRMCPRCNFGPVENIHCEDLMMHHGQEDLDGNSAAINNACPKCSFLTADWNDWAIWDGKLPDEITGGLEITPAPRRVRRVPCRFFGRGHCRQGEACTFLHAAPSRIPAREPRAAAPMVAPAATSIAAPPSAAPTAPPRNLPPNFSRRYFPGPVDQATALAHPPRLPIAPTTPQMHRLLQHHPNAHIVISPLDVPLCSARPPAARRFTRQCRFLLSPSGCIDSTCPYDHTMPSYW